MRIAYLTTCSPIPAASGHALRVSALWRALSTLGEVRVYAFDTRPPAAERLQLRLRGIRCLGARAEGRLDGTVRHLRSFATGAGMMYAKAVSPRRIARLAGELRAFGCDLLVVGDTWLADLVPALRGCAVRLVVDTHNVESELYRRLAAERPWAERPKLMLFQRNVAGLERHLAAADAVWATSPADAALYRDRLGLRRLAVVPNAVDTAAYRPNGIAAAPGTIVFTGGYGYWPNETAAMHLIAASRALSTRGVTHRVQLVGRDPTAAMRAAASAVPAVEITGAVADIRPWIAGAAVIAAPLTAGSGTKFKILEAMAMGRPVVTTPIGAEGLPIRDGIEAAVTSLSGFGARLEAALADPVTTEAMGGRGREWIERSHSLAALDVALGAALAELGG